MKFLISHCVGVPPELLPGHLMGPYQDLGRILIENGISRGVIVDYIITIGDPTLDP